MVKNQPACKVTDKFEIAPAMIEAGVSAFLEMVVGEDSDADIVTHILQSAFTLASLDAASGLLLVSIPLR